MAFDNIHNYYEFLVVRRLNDMIEAEFIDTDPTFLEDVACVSLNQLPSRYVKHDVDLVYYMSQDEREKIDYEVHKAVTAAIEYVNQHRNDRENTG
ncbi:hypothetical protein MNBD_GAMMA21-145 [hydrothermal vent metagenome]|uniref:Late competence development protein ComFB n=1 Tax=hydrothermal vent metagenome TaxID=652676 RepID=A0A3B0ZQ71_9ZZZZ